MRRAVDVPNVRNVPILRVGGGIAAPTYSENPPTGVLGHSPYQSIEIGKAVVQRQLILFAPSHELETRAPIT